MIGAMIVSQVTLLVYGDLSGELIAHVVTVNIFKTNSGVASHVSG